MSGAALLLGMLLAAASLPALADPSWAYMVKPQKMELRRVTHAGSERAIHGYLFRSHAASGRLAVYGPGCNGVDRIGRDYHVDHIRRLHAGGIDVLLLNSIGDRGLGDNGTCFVDGKDPRYVHTPMMAGDALAAVKWARANGYEAGRIGFFGFSQGARTGIWLAGERSLRGVTPPELRGQRLAFATIVLIYPDCWDWEKYAGGVGALETSLMVWGGDKDEGQPAACAKFFPAEARKAEFRDRIFPDTYHGYGFNLPRREVVFSGGMKKTSAYNPQAQEETFAGTVSWFNERLK
jgi:dienelactone hydrolase